MDAENRIICKALAAAALGAAIVAGGCAGDGTMASRKITALEQTIKDARTNTATVDAPVELRAAEEGLAAAKAALTDKDYDKASRLADKAAADADYARNKAVSAKSRKMADEVRDSVKTLRQEIERAPVK